MSDLISYAQNFEDVMLWRALGHVEHGHYIDVGAQSPDVDSVSRLFYERGWRGTHVEPVAAYAARLRAARPGEDVVQAVLASEPGALELFELPETGLSTLQPRIAEEHAGRGFSIRPITVPALTLDHILARYSGRQVHWLKVDVEGAEEDVLRGWRSDEVLPWIVLVESTLPLTQEQTHRAWEPCLTDKGYRFVYFDGLNRFYVAPGHGELVGAFRAGPNIFDGFALSGTASAPFCRPLTARIESLREGADLLEAEVAALQGQLTEQAHARAQAEAQQAELVAARDALQRGVDSLASRLEAEQARVSRMDGEHVARVRAMQAEITATALRLAQRESELGVAAARLEQLQSEHGALVEEFTQRGHELERHCLDAHRWWRVAESLRAELALIESSRSWRLTAPLRALRRSLGQGRVAVLTLFRPMVVRVVRAAVGRPRLARAGGVLLRPLPGARERLLGIARREGLLGLPEDATAAGVTIAPLTAAGAARHCGVRPLSRREQAVLIELQTRFPEVA